MTLWQNIIRSPFPTIEGEFGCDGRTRGQRYSLNLGLPYTPTYLKVASMTAYRIELDIESGNFDETLDKYRPEHLRSDVNQEKVTGVELYEAFYQV